MKDTLVSEYRKLVTTRTWWILLAAMAAYMVFIAAVMGFALTLDPSSGIETDMPAMDSRSIAITVYTLCASLGYVFPLLVGALSVTSEMRHRTLTPTLLGQPDRTRLVLAKLLASAPLGLLFGLVGTASTVGAGAAVLAIGGSDPHLGDSDVLAIVARTVLALAVWCVVGVGMGCALPNQVATVVVALAFTQLVEPLLRVLLGTFDVGMRVASFLPGAAGEAISGGSFYTTGGIGEVLPAWAGVLVLVGYGVVLAVVGRMTTFRRDIT